MEKLTTPKLVVDKHNKGYVDGMTHLVYGWLSALVLGVLLPSFLGIGFLVLTAVFVLQEAYQEFKCVSCGKVWWNPLSWTTNRYQDVLMPLIGYLVVVGVFKLLRII